MQEIIGKKLDGFTVEEYVEVYKTNFDGSKAKSLAFRKSEEEAEEVINKQVASQWFKTRRVLILTNGKIGFLLGEKIDLTVNGKNSDYKQIVSI